MPQKIMTVNGEIELDSLGITLMHEHIFTNVSGWWHCPSCKDRMYLAKDKVNMSILGELRMDPFVNQDNLVLNDVGAVTNELKELYKTVWEMSMKDIIDMSRHRGYFIDQSQSPEPVYGKRKL